LLIVNKHFDDIFLR